jgi:hypothetical protein
MAHIPMKMQVLYELALIGGNSQRAAKRHGEGHFHHRSPAQPATPHRQNQVGVYYQ